MSGYWRIGFDTPDLLKFACPYCGAGDVRLESEDVDGPGQTRYTVTCDACAASGPRTRTPHEAVACWNIRTR